MMPGSPGRILLRNPNLTQEIARGGPGALGPRQAAVPVQFVKYIAATAQGDLGYSFQVPGPARHRGHRRPRLWPTIILFGLGELIAIVVGLALGAYSGWRRGGAVD